MTQESAAAGRFLAQDEGRGPVWVRVAIVLLLLGFAVGVFADATADPPFGPSGLEGQLLLGARALVPDQGVVLGDWNPWFLAPSQLAVTAAAFRVGGVSPELTRRVNAGIAVILVAVFFIVVRRSLGPRRALLACVFLAANPAFFAAARYASPAPFSLLWMLLAVHLASGSGRGELTVHRTRAFAAGAALAWAAILENAPANLFFLGVGLVWSALVRLHAWKMPWVSATRRRLRWFWAGAGTLLALYAVILLLGRDDPAPTWSHILRVTPRLVTANIIRAPVHLAQLFRLMPVVTLISLLFFLFYGKSVFGPVARHRRLDEVRIWFFGWLVCAFGYFTVTGSQQLESLVLLVAPMCVVAAEGLSHLFRLRAIARPRFDVMIVVLLIAGFAWFAGCWLVDRFYPAGGDGFWEVHRIRGSYLLLAVLWPASTGFLIWLYLKWKNQSVRLASPLVLAATFGVVVGSLAPAAARAVTWWTGRTHHVDAARAQLAALPPGSLVVGSWAPDLTLGTAAGAAVIWHGVNDAPAPWHDRVTHLLLGDGEMTARHPVLRVFSREGRVSGLPETRLAMGEHGLRLIPLAPPATEP